MKSISQAPTLLATGLLAAMVLPLSGCSFTSEDGISEPADPAAFDYSGSMLPARITASNAISILKDVLNNTATFAGSADATNELIAGHTACSSGRYDRVSSSISYPFETTYEYVNCKLDGITHNYKFTFLSDYSDPQYLTSRINYDALSVYQVKELPEVYFLDEITVSSYIHGNAQISRSLVGTEDTITITLNLDVDDHENDRMQKFEGVDVVRDKVDVYDRDSPWTLSITGSPARYYDSERGYVDITTPEPLIPYRSMTSFRGTQGELVITGDSSSLRFIPRETYYFTIQLDLDGDHVMDLERSVRTEAIESTRYLDLDEEESYLYQ